jgi:hypothetical protein
VPSADVVARRAPSGLNAALAGLAHGKEGRADQPRQQGPLLLGWHVGRLMEQGLVAVAVPLSHRASLRWILM